MKKICIITAAMLMLLASCGKRSTVVQPTYSPISVSPEKSEYHVGDTVICSIHMLTPGSTNLQKSQYWFYANWWFSDPEITADFVSFDTIPATGDIIAVSSPIALTQAAVQIAERVGNTSLCFYGRLEYPAWDFRKIEIRKQIKVIQ